jgi:hypothetical protein
MGEFGGWLGEGKLQLETDDLIFRGATRLRIALGEITSAEAVAGWLVVEHAAGGARFDLGEAAAKWAHAIRHPRTRIDKLDVKMGLRVAVLAVTDDAFEDELRARAAQVVDAAGAGGLDLLFYGCEAPSGLDQLRSLRERIVPNGAVWLITPKGRPELGHEPIVAAAKAAGLIDTKTARFSATHTALKLVIPRAQRPVVQTATSRAASKKRG